MGLGQVPQLGKSSLRERAGMDSNCGLSLISYCRFFSLFLKQYLSVLQQETCLSSFSVLSESIYHDAVLWTGVCWAIVILKEQQGSLEPSVDSASWKSVSVWGSITLDCGDSYLACPFLLSLLPPTSLSLDSLVLFPAMAELYTTMAPVCYSGRASA